MIILSIYSSGTAICYIAYCLDKLGFAIPSLTESMLVISKDAVRVKIIHDRAVDYVSLEEFIFIRDACKRDRTVVLKSERRMIEKCKNRKGEYIV